MFTCPMHPEIQQPDPGHCPVCGMDLVAAGEADNAKTHHSADQSSYWPLVVIIGLILTVTIALAGQDWWFGRLALERSMSVFMAGFFIVFAGFKLMDLHGFAQGYFTYDLLARRWFGYGYIYPFLELGLGLSYALQLLPIITSLASVVLLVFSGLGVAQKLAKHERFQCACLGTFLKVPLTKVTLIEDFGMAGMALLMLGLEYLR